MEKTLLVGDMIFVDKLSYGPELLPGVLKTPGISKPKRGNVIVFENPTYLSRGANLYDFSTIALHGHIYPCRHRQRSNRRATSALSNKASYRGWRRYSSCKNGEVSIKPIGSSEFLDERMLMEGLGLPVKMQRLVNSSEYSEIDNVGIASAYMLSLIFLFLLGRYAICAKCK